jgi:hypothetical protein
MLLRAAIGDPAMVRAEMPVGKRHLRSFSKCQYTALSVHPLHGPELRALRPLQGIVFTTEAGTPVTTARVLRMIQRTGKAALSIDYLIGAVIRCG